MAPRRRKAIPKKRAGTPANDSDQPAKKRGRGRPSNAAKAAAAKENGEREEKKQASLEESFATDGDDAGAKIDGSTKPESDTKFGGETETNDEVSEGSLKKDESKGVDEHDHKNEIREAAEKDQKQDTDSSKILSEESSKVNGAPRVEEIPSSVLEKGVIYFFFRPRVNTDEPHGIEDIARSYIVLHPIDIKAKLSEATLEDDRKARLLALPKKQLPKSKQDRFLVFVEKVQAVKDLKDFFSSNDYATKTVGTSHSPAATPFAEGVYAITSVANASHLAYHITVPKEIGAIQKELGINEKGSFVVSAKNPETPSPANATIDNPARYPAEIQNKFRGLKWMPLIPELLEYEGTQFLIIGEGFGDLGNAIDESEKDKKGKNTETPAEELEKLEEEDHDRVEGLKESDPVFNDLDLSQDEYKDIQTAW